MFYVEHYYENLGIRLKFTFSTFLILDNVSLERRKQGSGKVDEVNTRAPSPLGPSRSMRASHPLGPKEYAQGEVRAPLVLWVQGGLRTRILLWA